MYPNFQQCNKNDDVHEEERKGKEVLLDKLWGKKVFWIENLGIMWLRSVGRLLYSFGLSNFIHFTIFHPSIKSFLVFNYFISFQRFSFPIFIQNITLSTVSPSSFPSSSSSSHNRLCVVFCWLYNYFMKQNPLIKLENSISFEYFMKAIQIKGLKIQFTKSPQSNIDDWFEWMLFYVVVDA